MFTTPISYTEGMEEIVRWANELPKDVSHRFMLDIYKTYIDWKFLMDSTAPASVGKPNSIYPWIIEPLDENS